MQDSDFERYRETGDFSTFSRATREGWRRLAQGVIARWRAPASVRVDDLVQEMLITCWSAVHGSTATSESEVEDEALGSRVKPWRPGHGTTLRSYVVWHALDKAEKYLHKKRKAGRAGSRGHSRFDMPFTALVRSEDDDGLSVAERLGPRSLPTQETELARKRMHASAGVFAPVLETFERTGSLEAATERCMASQGARELVGSYRFRDLRTGVRSMIQELAEQVIS